MGTWCTFRGHLALSEGTSLRHGEIGSCFFLQNFVWWYLGWNEEPTQNFSPIGGRLAGEPAFRKNCEGLEVTGIISNWKGRLSSAPIGLKFCVGTLHGYMNIPSKFRVIYMRCLEDAS